MKKTVYAFLVTGSVIGLLIFAACGGGNGDDWTELLINGGFETGDLTGWTMASMYDDSEFLLADSTMVPGISDTLAGPSEGSWYVVSQQYDPAAMALIQSFTVPDGDDEVRLTFDMFVLDKSGDGPIDAGGLDPVLDSNQHVRVDILSATAGTFDTGAGVVENLYKNVDGYEPVVPYTSYSIDISPMVTAGETYQLRFAEGVSLASIRLGVDNVSVRSR